MFRETVEPKQSLLETIQKRRSHYKEAVLRFVIVKQKDENILHWGRIDFTHRSDASESDVTYDYGQTFFIKRIYTLDEMVSLIELLPSELINIKDFESVFVRGKFDASSYHIPSKTHYLEVMENWPIQYFSYKFDHDRRIDSVYNFLIKEGLPAYPDLTAATRAFLHLDRNYNLANPFGIIFTVPDYRARIVSMEIMENHLTVTIEQKESSLDDLLLKFFYRNENTELDLPETSVKNTNRIEIPNFPDELHVYLYDKKSDEVLDYRQYGNHNTERQEGIIVKTSREQIESMLIAKEGKEIEFKSKLDSEFLESVVAFANTDGGTILLGVDNRANVIGFHDDYASTEKRIRGMISGGCEPQIDVDIQQVTYQNQPLIIVKVKKGLDKPYLVKEKTAYKRIDERDIQMNRHDLDEIYGQKQRR